MPSSPKHFILYSHGFGVQKDSRGFFTQIKDNISKYLPNSEHIFFDYNVVNINKKELVINPFSVQIQILKNQIKEIKTKHSDLIMDIIAHSQGCLIVALLCPEVVNKTILICPPVSTSVEKNIKSF